MKAEYIENTENDLMIVNAARVSFDKESKFRKPYEEVDTDSKHFQEWTEYTNAVDITKPIVNIGDFGLIKYLFEHNHFTPFTHSRLTFDTGYEDCEIVRFDKLTPENMAGMVHSNYMSKIRHSIWGWKTLIDDGVIVDEYFEDYIKRYIAYKYPATGYIMFGIVQNEMPHDQPLDDGMQSCFLSCVESSKETEEDFIDITMRETVPIFVARQRFKHKVGFIENEISRRYVDDTPDFFYPDSWRAKPEKNKKQGSSDKTIDYMTYMNRYMSVDEVYDAFLHQATFLYESLLDAGISPEQARMVLPQSMYTSYYVTGNVKSWRRAIDLRKDAHAQKEIQDLSKQWQDVLNDVLGGPKESELVDAWNMLGAYFVTYERDNKW